MQSMQEQAWLIDVVHRLQREHGATCAMVVCGGRTAEACCGCVCVQTKQSQLGAQQQQGGSERHGGENTTHP